MGAVSCNKHGTHPGPLCCDHIREAVYRSSAAIPFGIYRFDLTDTTLQHLTDVLPTAIGDALSVAPDGRSLVVARTDAVEVDLMYVPAVEDAAR